MCGRRHSPDGQAWGVYREYELSRSREDAYASGDLDNRQVSELDAKSWAGGSEGQVSGWLDGLPLVSGITETVGWCRRNGLVPVLATLAWSPVGSYLTDRFGQLPDRPLRLPRVQRTSAGDRRQPVHRPRRPPLRRVRQTRFRPRTGPRTRVGSQLVRGHRRQPLRPAPVHFRRTECGVPRLGRSTVSGDGHGGGRRPTRRAPHPESLGHGHSLTAPWRRGVAVQAALGSVAAPDLRPPLR